MIVENPVSLDDRIARLDKEIAEEVRQKREARRKRWADWLTHLRTAVADADAVTRDMLRVPADRELGPVKHRELYKGAASKIAHLLDNLPEGDEPRAPGGAT